MAVDPTAVSGWQQYVLLVGSAAIAGAVNSVAGGGTLLTFPALLAANFTSTAANATSTVALWPGQLSSLWGLRSEIGQNGRSFIPLTVIGLIGGFAGALLLVRTPPGIFDRLVPFLVLLATCLFMAQEPLSRWQKERAARASQVSPPPGPPAEEEGVAPTSVPPAVADPEAAPKTALHLTPGVALFLLGIAIYGGYFGAGIGILTLAALGLLGLTNLHQMNGIKAVFTLGVNGVAVVLFILKGLVDWRIAGIMALGSIFGGYAGAGIARRIGQKNVRRIVITIGLLLTVSLLRKFLPW